MSRFHLMQVVEFGGEVLFQKGDLFRCVEITLADLGGTKGGIPSFKEGHSDLLLDLFDGGTQTRLGNVEFFRGFGEALFVIYRKNVVFLLKHSITSISIFIYLLYKYMYLIISQL